MPKVQKHNSRTDRTNQNSEEMMLLFNLETMIPLAGILLGITFGLISGISREEKVKYIAISVFGTIIVAFTGISFYSYGYSLEVLLGFLVWSCIGFIPTFLIGLGYRRRRDKPFFGILPSLSGLSSREIEKIQRNAPKMDAKLRILGNSLFGFKIEISLKIHNTSNELLDKLYAILKVSDLCLEKKEKELLRDLPNLVQGEERKFTISKRIGRHDKYAIDLRILRKGVLLEEFHWTPK